MSKTSTELLKGAYDLHVHSSPDLIKRSTDCMDLAMVMKSIRMGGFVIKNHFFPTYGMASIVRKLVPEVKVFGGVVLNNPVGGLNPQTVDVTGRMGGKIIWMPTIDAHNEKDRFQKTNRKTGHWATIQRELYEGGMLRPPIYIKDNNGQLKPEIDEILELINKYNMILATGHLSPEESISLIKRAREKRIDKIVVTHPEFPSTNFSIKEQMELKKYGVYFERCFTTPATGKIEWSYVLEEIKKTGSERNILSTDLGQPSALPPVDGYKKFVEYFMENGLSDNEITQMVSGNQQKLLFE